MILIKEQRTSSYLHHLPTLMRGRKEGRCFYLQKEDDDDWTQGENLSTDCLCFMSSAERDYISAKVRISLSDLIQDSFINWRKVSFWLPAKWDQIIRLWTESHMFNPWHLACLWTSSIPPSKMHWKILPRITKSKSTVNGTLDPFPACPATGTSVCTTTLWSLHSSTNVMRERGREFDASMRDMRDSANICHKNLRIKDSARLRHYGLP